MWIQATLSILIDVPSLPSGDINDLAVDINYKSTKLREADGSVVKAKVIETETLSVAVSSVQPG